MKPSVGRYSQWLLGSLALVAVGGALVLGPTMGGLATVAAAEEAAAEPEQRDLKATERDYELFKLFVDTLDQVERNYVEEVDRRELMEAAIEGLIGKLDPYSNYISPEEVEQFRTNLESQFGGVGIQVGMEKEGGKNKLKIVSPLVGTPAYEAGLHAGDEITEIEGESTEGLGLDEVVNRLKGAIGTAVTITVKPAFVGETREVTLRRELIRVETVMGDHRADDDSWDFYLDADKKIAYIRITSFSRETPRELREAMEKLSKQGLRGLILDLRFNPGGLLTAAIDICDLFVSEGKIVSTKGRNIRERTWEAHQAGTYTGFPMAVLVNRYSASASEIVSACLQDNNRAIVVGERTWGKGSVQNVIDLEGGKSALKLTTASYWRPSGKNIHRFPGVGEDEEWGVTPNDGYLIKLNNEQMRQVMEQRRERDMLQWTKADAEAAAGVLGPMSEAVQAPAAVEPLTDPQLARALDFVSSEVAKAEAE